MYRTDKLGCWMQGAAWCVVLGAAVAAMAQSWSVESGQDDATQGSQVVATRTPTVAKPSSTPTPILGGVAEYIAAASRVWAGYNKDPSCATRKQARIALLTLKAIIDDKTSGILIHVPPQAPACP
jgi:hypothetical protein